MKINTIVLPASTSFDISDSYQITAARDKFLICDTLICRKKKEMLIFAIPKQLELLFNSSTVFYTIPLEEGCGSVDDNKVVHMYI
jgi:hypothetical protein